MGESRCRVCREMTETDFIQEVAGYVAHYCGECGADKRDCGSAPV